MFDPVAAWRAERNIVRCAAVEADEKNNGLTATDVANAVLYAIDQPDNVAVNEVLLRPVTQQR